MVTVILPGDITRELSTVISKFLERRITIDGTKHVRGEMLVDDIFYLVKPLLEAEDSSLELLRSAHTLIKSNLIDTLTIICFDRIVDALGEKGFGGTVRENVEGRFNTNFICRTSHIEMLLGGSLADIVMEFGPLYDFMKDRIVDSIVHYDIYSELSGFLEESILSSHENKALYMMSLLSTIVNLQGYLDFNIRDVINTTLVDGCLVLFLRGSLDDEDCQYP